ncbi:hypothetical protein M758_12G075500 [Ceratodon purpureus]|nr:hypothetical protein M758_12G075500 [Ceratodon purpureus]
MAVLDLAKIRRARSISFLLLLTFSSSVSASDSPTSNFKGYRSRSSSIILQEQELVGRKLAAFPPGPDLVVSGAPAPTPSPSTLKHPPPPSSNPPRAPPPPPSNKRPALITPSADAPGADLPPKDLNTPPPSRSPPPLLAPISSQAETSTKQSNTAVILGVTLGVVVVLVVSVSAAAFFKPDWLPCCKGRDSQLNQYQRHIQT